MWFVSSDIWANSGSHAVRPFCTSIGGSETTAGDVRESNDTEICMKVHSSRAATEYSYLFLWKNPCFRSKSITHSGVEASALPRRVEKSCLPSELISRSGFKSISTGKRCANICGRKKQFILLNVYQDWIVSTADDSSSSQSQVILRYSSSSLGKTFITFSPFRPENDEILFTGAQQTVGRSTWKWKWIKSEQFECTRMM